VALAPLPPFQSVAVDYIKTSYGEHTTEWASTRASTVYMVSMVVSPFLGKAVDYFGRRDWLAIGGTALSIPVFLLLGQPSVEPFVPLLMLGCCYSVCAAALWPTVQLLVDMRMVGRANGIATSMQMLGIGICQIIIGALKDGNKELSKLAAPCCLGKGKDIGNTCFDDTGGGVVVPTCMPAKYGSCSDVKNAATGVEFKNSCQGTNYGPMLNFFVGMACAAMACAFVLKWLDRHEHALYIGRRDKIRAYAQKYQREPETEQDMADATRLVRQQLRAGGSARIPLLDADDVDA
jgi:hypothetical protein